MLLRIRSISKSAVSGRQNSVNIVVLTTAFDYIYYCVKLHNYNVLSVITLFVELMKQFSEPPKQ